MNTKKIAAIVLFGLTMTTCASPAVGEVNTINYKVESKNSTLIKFIQEVDAEQTRLEKEAAAKTKLINDTNLMNKTLKKLTSYVGKTWYVFSGSTPSGWDCSGMTSWFYEQQNVALEHRASKQSNAGESSSLPKPGDIVVFTYKGYKSAYHVGIYIGKGLMIHAPRVGEVTRIESVEGFASNYSNVTYRTIVKTN